VSGRPADVYPLLPSFILLSTILLLSPYLYPSILRSFLPHSLLVTKTKALRDTEAENIQLGRNKKGKGPGRDLSSFRKTLELLQRQVDEIDVLKADYHEEVAEGEEEIWEEGA
jgi:hypothetical protein